VGLGGPEQRQGTGIDQKSALHIFKRRRMSMRSIEMIKQDSRHLRGRLYEEVFLDRDAGVSEDSRQLLKFFGMYQQQDRDIKKKLGHETPYTFMIRVATPGGVMSRE
jgi:sulfite reductase (ferredoxin)